MALTRRPRAAPMTSQKAKKRPMKMMLRRLLLADLGVHVSLSVICRVPSAERSGVLCVG